MNASNPNLREELNQLLIRWNTGILTADEVHLEAERLLDNHGWIEINKSDPRSIEYELLSQLDLLNHQLITKDDISAMLCFLHASAGDEIKAWENWAEYWTRIDINKRLDPLADC